MTDRTMEPDDAPVRLAHVTAQNPGTDGAHASHDRLLVARFATGDALAADESATVRALLASCGECSALVGDLQAVQHATATSLAPRRPRDFFLAPEQAATLRPNAWQRFLGRLSAPKAGVLRPMAGATLAIGIVLVGASAVMPRGDTVMVQEPGPVANGTFQAPEMDNGGGNIAGTGPAATGLDGTMRQGDPMTAKESPALDRAYGVQAEASPGTGMGTMESAPGASPDPRIMLTAPDGTQPPAPQASPKTADIRVTPTSGPAGEDQSDVSIAASAQQAPADTTGSALLILGLLLAVVSILVLVLSWLARRTIDPLLR
jgi:hypothetical protein